MNVCVLLSLLYHKGTYYGYKLTHAQTFDSAVLGTRLHLEILRYLQGI